MRRLHSARLSSLANAGSSLCPVPNDVSRSAVLVPCRASSTSKTVDHHITRPYEKLDGPGTYLTNVMSSLYSDTRDAYLLLDENDFSMHESLMAYLRCFPSFVRILARGFLWVTDRRTETGLEERNSFYEQLRFCRTEDVN